MGLGPSTRMLLCGKLGGKDAPSRDWAQTEGVVRSFIAICDGGPTNAFRIEHGADNAYYAGWVTDVPTDYSVAVASRSYTLNQNCPRWVP